MSVWRNTMYTRSGEYIQSLKASINQDSLPSYLGLAEEHRTLRRQLPPGSWWRTAPSRWWRRRRPPPGPCWPSPPTPSHCPASVWWDSSAESVEVRCEYWWGWPLPSWCPAPPPVRCRAGSEWRGLATVCSIWNIFGQFAQFACLASWSWARNEPDWSWDELNQIYWECQGLLQVHCSNKIPFLYL